MPAAQFVQAVTPEVEKVPAEQLTQTVAPVAGWYWPAVHTLQSVEAVAAVVAKYRPAAHLRHEVEAEEDW